MTLELQAVANAMGARWDGPPNTVSGWSVDTRTQNPGDVYFALRGPNHDGHDFIAAALAKGPTQAIGEIKTAIRQGVELPLDAALALERGGIARLFMTRDAREGMDAFAEKRKPAWRGE